MDGLPPSLTGDATPKSVCQQASTAIISLTNTYHARYSLTHPPPLLPYIVFAAVLYQLSLGLDLPDPSQQGPGLVESSPVLSPTTTCDSPSISGAGAGVPGPTCLRAETSTTTSGLEPMSFGSCMTPQGPSQRRVSVLSAASGGLRFPSSGLLRRPNVYNLMSSTASDKDGMPSPDAEPDTLPTLTWGAADLVAIGSLQLASMGSQHAGAAEAARSLQGVEHMRKPTEFQCNQARHSPPLAEPPHPVPVAGGLITTI